MEALIKNKLIVLVFFTSICINANKEIKKEIITLQNTCKNFNQNEEFTKVLLQKLINLTIPAEARKAKLIKRQTKINKHLNTVSLNKELPIVSFIIPCYNRELVLVDVIESIYNQNLTIPFEVVAVDDASADNSFDILKKYEKEKNNFFVYKHQINKKAPATRNTAILYSRGEYIFNADSDDIFLPNTLNTMIDYCIKQNLDMCTFEELRFFDDIKNSPITSIGKSIPPNYIIRLQDFISKFYICLHAGNRLFKKSCWLNVGGYLEQPGHDSWSFSALIITRGYKTGVCPMSAYLHRNWTNGNGMFREDNKNKVNDISPKIIVHENAFIFNQKSQKKLSKLNFEDGFFIPFIDSGNLQASSQANIIFEAYKYEDSENYTEALQKFITVIENGCTAIDILWRSTRCALKINDLNTANKILEKLIKYY